MSVFDRAEKRIGAAVNKVFARAFKGDVQPVEIASGITRELDTEAKLLGRGRRLVPNAFTVWLSEHDYNRLFPYSKTINAEIIPGLRTHAAEHQYIFNGPITITYELDGSLPVGQFKLESEATDPDTGRPATPPSQGRVQPLPRDLVLEVGGVRHPLRPPGFMIGRGSDADVRINDPGVSRRHALITVSGPPEQQVITIEDLGSTNGVVVNGVRVQRTALREGSRIELGNTRILVHSPLEP